MTMSLIPELIAAGDTQAGSTLLKFISGGGLIGYIIIALSITWRGS